MTMMDSYRDDGPLAAALPRSQLPVPGVALTVVAAMVPLAAFVLPIGNAAILVGGLAALLGRSGEPHERLDWAEPGLLRAFEYGAILLLVGNHPVAYSLLAVLAFHHYDVVYRLRGGGPTPPPWLGLAAGGWELRTLVVTAGALAGRPTAVALGMTLVLGSLLVGESITAWRRQLSPGPTPT
jgi:hypothetical protein